MEMKRLCCSHGMAEIRYVWAETASCFQKYEFIHYLNTQSRANHKWFTTDSYMRSMGNVPKTPQNATKHPSCQPQERALRKLWVRTLNNQQDSAMD